jgi:hypothetical protein
MIYATKKLGKQTGNNFCFLNIVSRSKLTQSLATWKDDVIDHHLLDRGMNTWYIYEVKIYSATCLYSSSFVF